MSDSQERAYNSIIMPRVSKIHEAIGVANEDDDEDDDPTNVLEAARQGESVDRFSTPYRSTTFGMASTLYEVNNSRCRKLF